MTKNKARLILFLLIAALIVFNALPIMATATPLLVRMYNGNTAAQINTIFPWFKITNTGSAPVNLAEVKIRYYYTIDGEKPQRFWCDWSNIGAGNVTGTFVKLKTPFSGADHYFELGFKPGAGTIKPGQSVEAQNRFAKHDWSNYNQTNDYSFNPTARTYVDWDKITVHLGNDLSTSHDYAYGGQWVNRPITIRLTASGGSGSLTTYYKINNGPTITGNLIQLNEDGEYNVSFWSADSSGNSETPQSLTVKLDQAPPLLGYSLSPAPNAAGWHNQDVKITFNATDGLSGIQTVAPPLTIATEGAGQVVNGTGTDLAGNSATVAVSVNLDKTPPLISNLQPANGAQINRKRPAISAGVFDGLSGIDPAAVLLTLDGYLVNGTFNPVSGIVSYTPVSDLSSGSHSISLTATDLAGDPVTAGSSFMIISSDPNLPPDPAEVAPALDPAIVSDMKTATSFLYTGENPIQTGMDPEIIEPVRAAVIRGKVLDKDGQPLPGVKLTVLNHGEYGQTLSRADGMFDLAVNGGGYLTVRYEKEGYLPAQRQVNVPWQDYVWAEEVILVKQDDKVTTITLNSDQAQIHQGSLITDSDGQRRATIVFPKGIQVSGMDGGINIRATEYTVGLNGPKAMPAELPSTTFYTYCVELTADEAEHVEFNKPVFFYVENFLNFPAGCIVPVGYYDKGRGVWVPCDDGRTIRILSINDGIATVDLDGTGQAATTKKLGEFGFTTEELQNLAGMYQVGQSLWRAPVKHFSTYDLNYGATPDEGAESPNGGETESDEPTPEPEIGCGSVIDIQNQILGENVSITGTPFYLNYSSDRVPGRTAVNKLKIPLSGSQVPEILKKIILRVTVAGQLICKEFPAEANQSFEFDWDGLDGYSRPVYGGQQATTEIGFVYDGFYNLPPSMAQSFGYPSGTPVPGNIRAREGAVLWKTFYNTLEKKQFKDKGVGGWSLSVHHFYDTQSKTINLGTGGKQFAQNLREVKVFAGNQEWRNDDEDEGKPALETCLDEPNSIAFGPDGNIYFAERNRIRKIDKQGIVTTIIGKKMIIQPDNNDQDEDEYISPRGLLVGKFGELYFIDKRNNFDNDVKVVKNGVIETYAQTGLNATSLAMSNFGNLYIGSLEDAKINWFWTDKSLKEYAGTGEWGYGGDGDLAFKASLNPSGMISGKNDNVYVAEYYNNRVRKISPNGVITTVAGNGEFGYEGDGGPAIQANLDGPVDVAEAPDGSLYIVDFWNGKIRRVGTDGIISTYADISKYAYTYGCGFAPENPSKIIIGADGCLYVSLYYAEVILQIGPPFPGFNEKDIAVASTDGSEVYHFNPNGRHLRTLDALTGTVKYTFEYDGAGNLIRVTDAYGNTTTIERTFNGVPTGIVAPFGQRTILSINNEGYLNWITNPANETVRMSYQPDGLLETFIDSRNGVHRFSYDNDGRLIRDEDPAGGYIALERVKTENGYQVTKTEGVSSRQIYATTYLEEKLPNGDNRRVVSGCCGGLTETVTRADGGTRLTAADGTITETTVAPDPRFGMQAPVIRSETVTTPEGKTYQLETEKTVILNEWFNPWSIETITTTTTINGRTSTGLYDAATQTITVTSPEGRKTVTTLDEKGRLSKSEIPGLAPVVMEYDSYGRLVKTTTSSGSEARVSLINYNSQGYVASTVDPLNRTTGFYYDAAGRVIKQFLPDGKEISFTYDAAGNLTSLTPPGRPGHGFEYTAVNLEKTYMPPEVGAGDNITEYAYNLARQPALVTRPDGKTIGFSYDTNGRLQEILIPEGEVTFAYHATTENLTNILAPDSTLSFSYDGSLPTKTAWAGTVSGNIGMVYNDDLMVTSQSVNDGNNVSYGYDDDGLLVTAGSLTISRNTQNGMMTRSSIGGVADSVTYNSFGETISYRATYSGSTVFETQYQTDKLGRIETKTETADGVTYIYRYVYDLIGQLTDVYKDGALVSHYDYDANGNRVRYTGTNGTFNGTYDDQDRLLSYGGNKYQYTANGELLSKTNSSGTTLYNYDVLGNLRVVTLPDETRLEYLIDGQNRRIGKKVNGTLVQGWLYQNGLNPVAELDANGNVVARFVYGTRANVPDYLVKKGVTYRIISDHLGSVRMVADVATGQVIQRIDYSEFGEVINDTAPGFQPLTFAGGLYDSQTKLVRFGARDYDAEVGRWTCKDPIRFVGGSLNLFAYVNNAPINWTDIFGLARFGKRPLSGWPWLEEASSNWLDDYFNTEVSHEHLFFDDGTNIGFRDNERFSEKSSEGYRFDNKHYDDDLMREALNNIVDGKYSLLGLDGKPKNNCQDWCDRLRREYERLKTEREKNVCK